MAPPRTDPVPRFWSKVDKLSTACWVWTGYVSPAGYGEFWEHSNRTFAHIFSYRLAKGEVPPGYEIDHLCRNTRCVNPTHLEAVPHSTNTLRGVGPSAVNARKTHCHKGHPFSEENTYIYPKSGKRLCKECHRNNQRDYVSSKKSLGR